MYFCLLMSDIKAGTYFRHSINVLLLFWIGFQIVMSPNGSNCGEFQAEAFKKTIYLFIYLLLYFFLYVISATCNINIANIFNNIANV